LCDVALCGSSGCKITCDEHNEGEARAHCAERSEPDFFYFTIPNAKKSPASDFGTTRFYPNYAIAL